MEIALYVCLAALGILVLALVVKTLLMKKKLPGTPPAVSWTPEEENAYAETLSALVKLPTVSRKQGESWEDFAVYHEKIAALFPLVDKTAENHDRDGNILRRIPGADPKRGALLLMGHQDVVPAEGQTGWTKDPFSGEIEDGAVWGRGSMDCKGTFCAEWLAVEELLREGFVFKEDLWLFSSRNEENGGGGAELVVEYLKNKGVRLSMVLDEGGAVVGDQFPGLCVPISAVGLAEKGFVNLKFVARSAGGHSSTPPKNTPIVRLSQFVASVEKHPPFKKKLVSPVSDTFAALSPYMNFPFRLLLGNLWLFGPLVKRVMPAVSPMAGAFLATTAAFTQAGGSAAPNVLPDEAYVICNMRPALHQGAKESIELLKKRAARYDVDTEVLFCKEPSRLIRFDTDEAAFLSRCVSDCLPDTVVSPYLMTGGTDSRRFEPVCDNVFRFTPTRLTKSQLAAMHAANENLSTSALAEAAKTYKVIVTRWSGNA
ncbi:MAG: M20/M25/M40 family metallo-hydrolase [Clostridia bacterium]|nr:M20/M25/M40 family metallo-hydrolase [Clostridia bacterium]